MKTSQSKVITSDVRGTALYMRSASSLFLNKTGNLTSIYFPNKTVLKVCEESVKMRNLDTHSFI